MKERSQTGKNMDLELRNINAANISSGSGRIINDMASVYHFFLMVAVISVKSKTVRGMALEFINLHQTTSTKEIGKMKRGMVLEFKNSQTVTDTKVHGKMIR